MLEKIRVLLIDQDEESLRAVKDILIRETHDEFQLEQEKTLAQSIARLCEGGIDLVLLDLTLPDGKGVLAISEIYRHAPQVPIIAMNITDSDELAKMAVREGAQDFIVKAGWEKVPLVRMMFFAIERKKTEQQLARLASFAWQNPNPILETDSKGKLIYSNPAAKTLFPELEIQQEKHPFLKGLHEVALRLDKNNQILEIREIEIDGSFYEQHISYMADNDVIRSYIMDHTERKKTEEKLVARTHEVERMNRLMVGREIKMKELKETIENLKQRLNRAA